MAQFSIHIHEDDWGMRCLYPAAAWPEAVADLERAIEAGQRNRAPDGIGWSDVYVIKPPAVDFVAVGLEMRAAAEGLVGLLPRVRRFAATASAGFSSEQRDPYGSYDEDAWCFGFDATCFLKLEPAGDLVRGIWFEARTSDAAQLSQLREAIELIDRLCGAMIIDYWADAAGRVDDRGFMDRYFGQLAG